MTKEAKSFKENYEKLNQLLSEIDELKDQDIDELTEKVNSIIELSEDCRERVVKIKKDLEDKLEQ